ncbi:glutamate 5-kinase [Thalassotalea agarivorans]|uniref:Glutamate 5-kinase n=1 Tax=Thalassotalea agarivorans TaxID=349064 RepID=A0A1I0CQY2_THASX|nr:glutamate 5-kinase [Thalassotalea agarivorans]SET21644.1 glutamate 5-kinase [Thalassotalea agarivorans]
MQFNRIVIKVGSALVAPGSSGCSGEYLLAIAQFITKCQQLGKEVLLVSSGSVAAGRNLIPHGSPNLAIPTKQAMASVGQMQMMANWQRFFDKPCSQLLLTHGDLKDRQRYINIKNTLRVLLENQILPIVNENDTVATEELKVGDNDNLAAQVALVSEADCLIILSDIDGVFDKNPKLFDDATLLPEIPEITADIYALAGSTANHIATGGMKTKIEAAEKATENGIATFIVNGKSNDTFKRLLDGQNPGTYFAARQPAAKAKKYWLKHTLKSHGQLHLDQGASVAVLKKGASLLPSGISSVKGQFLAGESIDIVAPNGDVIAKGISQYSANDLNKIKGVKSDQIASVLGYCQSKVVVHRDDLVIVGVSHEQSV